MSIEDKTDRQIMEDLYFWVTRLLGLAVFFLGLIILILEDF